MYIFILFDTFSKSIIGVYDDEKIVKQKINKSVRTDIDDELFYYRMKILDETNAEKRQTFSMVSENLQTQQNIKDIKNCYVKNGDVIQRYIYFTKIVNNSENPTFIYGLNNI